MARSSPRGVRFGARGVLWATGIAAVAALLLLSAGCVTKPGERPAAPDFRLTTLDGAYVNLSVFSGRTLVLDLFGTTCGPCIKEAPELRAFAAAHPDVALLSVGVDPTDSVSDLDAFRVKHNETWPLAPDTDHVFSNFHATDIPTLFVIDKTGHIAATHRGSAVNAATLAQLVAGA